MRNFVLISALAAAAVSGSAFAACPGTSLSKSQIDAQFTGNTICVGGSNNWQAQELHQTGSGGRIKEYARGPGHANDPSKEIGTWTTEAANNTITYNYDGGSSSGPYQVHKSGSTINFCVGSNVVVPAKLQVGSGACQ